MPKRRALAPARSAETRLSPALAPCVLCLLLLADAATRADARWITRGYRGGTRVDSGFDSRDYYASAYPPQITRSYTNGGIALRQTTSTISLTDQLAGTGIQAVYCDLRTKTWRVDYENALSVDAFGETLLSVRGNCALSDTGPFFDLASVTGTKNVTRDADTGVEYYTELFTPSDPNLRRSVLVCTFQLFSTRSAVASVGSGQQQLVPTQVDSVTHRCNRKASVEGINGTGGCGFFEIGCQFDSDEYPGSAVFWYIIYGASLLLYVLIFSAPELSSRLRDVKASKEVNHTQAMLKMLHDGDSTKAFALEDTAAFRDLTDQEIRSEIERFRSMLQEMRNARAQYAVPVDPSYSSAAGVVGDPYAGVGYVTAGAGGGGGAPFTSGQYSAAAPKIRGRNKRAAAGVGEGDSLV